jgi:hypothetical protein
MINIDELEKNLEEISKTETGKSFNKWIPETKTDMLLQSIQNCKERNLEIQLHKGELVIDGHKIVRLDDVVDGDDDYYWVYNDWVGLKGIVEKNTGVYLSSCVGQHTLLKGFIPDDEYKRIVYQWNLNNFIQAI